MVSSYTEYHVQRRKTLKANAGTLLVQKLSSSWLIAEQPLKFESLNQRYVEGLGYL